MVLGWLSFWAFILLMASAKTNAPMRSSKAFPMATFPFWMSWKVL
jgi:hypothetical protein